MLIAEAKPLVGQIINLTYTDRTESEVTEEVEVYDVTFVPLYGPCMITCKGDIRLDRIVGHTPAMQYRAA